MFLGYGAERVDRDFTNAARRSIEHAEEGDVVVGKHRHAHVGEGVFYFGALVEAEAAEQL